MPLRTGSIFSVAVSLIVAVSVMSGCNDDDSGPIASQIASDTLTPTASATQTPGPATATPTPGEFRRLFTIPNDDPELDRAGAVAVNANTSVIYVANSGFFGGEVWVFDEATRALQASYPVGEGPAAIEYDPVNNFILTLNGFPSKDVSILDADTGTEVARVEVPQGWALRSLMIDDAGERAYVGTTSGVSIIDLGTLAVVKEVPLLITSALDMAFDPATGILYVMAECNKARSRSQIIEECRFSSALVALDGSSGEVLFEIILERQAIRLAIDSISQTAYVALRLSESVGTKENALLVVDLESRTVKERIDLPRAEPLAVDETGRIVYVSAFNTLILLDADTYEVLKTIRGSLEAADMAFSSTTGRLYVSNGKNGIVVFGR